MFDLLTVMVIKKQVFFLFSSVKLLRLGYVIHVEKVEMRVYCDIKAETIVCKHRCTHLERP